MTVENIESAIQRIEEVKMCITICSGGGLVDIGLIAAGYKPIGAIEIEPAIVDVYRANVANDVTVQDVRETDWNTFDKPTLLWASPSCKNASIANNKAGESELDIEVAQAICRAIETLAPESFILENVRGYASFKAFGLIIHTLERLGYWHNGGEVLNSANFGVPQTRVRLILRAKRAECVQSGQAGIFGGGRLAPLGHKEKWRGWYDAVEDLIPGLPDSQFAEWQLARMPDLVDEGSFVVEGSAAGIDNKFTMPVRDEDEPIFTQRSGQNVIRAFIASGGNGSRELSLRDDLAPVFTVRSESGGKEVLRAMLERGRVVKMTPRALARFQTLPDSYELPDRVKVNWVCGGRGELATTIIGNGVPCRFAEKIARLHEAQ